MDTSLLKRCFWGLAVLSLVFCASGRTLANDMPTAAGSPIAGISFDDRPLMLPVQRNFQMAMLTVSSELGRSCGRMEAYGWRTDPSEQDRVNQLFNNTVDRMRAQGYTVESKKTNAVSRDVTLFTADRTDRHLIFLWSAGEIGLVMVLCETSAPLSPIPLNAAHETEAPQPATLPSHLPLAETVRASKQPLSLTPANKSTHAHFSPIGRWVGSYTCAQGTTGATLDIDSMKGDQFEGSFSFYPTPKNPYVSKGKYRVFGEYDADSQRILINPGQWVQRPKDYYNTIMIGSFDPVAQTFSGYFQGITGCTSFEANAENVPSLSKSREPVSVKAKTPAKSEKKAVKKKTVKKSSANTDSATKPAVVSKSTVEAAPAKAVAPAPRESAIEPPAVGIAIGEPAPVKP